MDRWLINGTFANAIDANDRGLHYGDGLFETLAVRSGDCRFLEAHYQRLTTGCERLRIPCPDFGMLSGEIGELINGQPDGVLKIIVTRGIGERGYAPPAHPEPTRMLGYSAVAPGLYPERGVRLLYCATHIATNPALAGLKTLNRLEQVLGRAELQHSDYAEGLMLDVHGQVVCGTMSNLFAVMGEELVTPDLANAGVSGIMRMQIINVANEAGIPVRVSHLRPAELAAAESLFVTNALIGLWPVAELDGQTYAVDTALIKTLRDGLAAHGVTECCA